MPLESLLNGHAFLDLIFHSIICCDQVRQHRDKLRDFVLWNDHYPIPRVAKNEVPRLHNGSIQVQPDLGGMRLCFRTGARDGLPSSPDLSTGEP